MLWALGLTTHRLTILRVTSKPFSWASCNDCLYESDFTVGDTWRNCSHFYCKYALFTSWCNFHCIAENGFGTSLFSFRIAGGILVTNLVTFGNSTIFKSSKLFVNCHFLIFIGLIGCVLGEFIAFSFLLNLFSLLPFTCLFINNTAGITVSFILKNWQYCLMTK